MSEHQRNLKTVESLVIKWKEEGNSHYNERNYKPAIEQYSKIIQLLRLQHGLFQSPNSNPNNIDGSLRESLINVLYVSHSNRCACFLQLGDLLPAYNDAKECIALKSDWPKGYHRLANCLVRLERFEEAIVAYEQLLLLEESQPQQLTNIRQAIEKTRELMRSHAQRSTSQPSSSSTQTNNNHNPNANSNGNNNRNRQPAAAPGTNPVSSFFSSLSDGISSFDYQSWFAVFKRISFDYYSRALLWYSSLTEEYRNYLKIGVIALMMYLFFFSNLFSSFGGSSYSSDSHYHGSHRQRPSSSYYDEGYGGGYGGYGSYGGYSRGMSWSAWIAIIAGAYYLPPLLPQFLGEQFARPFFGLNFTTFIWLLQMFSNSNRGGYGGGGFNYGRPRRRYF